MAALQGKEFLLQADFGAGYVSVLTARSNSFNQSREIVDVTTKGSAGNRELLTGGGVKSATITLEGVFEEDDFQDALQSRIDAGSIDTYRMIQVTSGIQFEGDFQVESIDFSGEYNDAVVYSVTLQSSGAITKTDTVSD